MRKDNEAVKKRRKSKEACQEARDKRTDQDQLDKLNKLGPGAVKEKARLEKRIAKGSK